MSEKDFLKMFDGLSASEQKSFLADLKGRQKKEKAEKPSGAPATEKSIAANLFDD